MTDPDVLGWGDLFERSSLDLCLEPLSVQRVCGLEAGHDGPHDTRIDSRKATRLPDGPLDPLDPVEVD